MAMPTMPKKKKGATAGTAAPKGEEATMLSEGSTVQTSGQGWLPLRWAGLEGYELARAGDRVRSWRKPGGLGGGKCGVTLADHPTEIKVRSGVVQLGVVCGCEAGGRQNRRNMAVQVEFLRTAVLGDELAVRELERRLGRLQSLDQADAALRQTAHTIRLDRCRQAIARHVPGDGAVAFEGVTLDLRREAAVAAGRAVQHEHRGACAQRRKMGQKHGAMLAARG